MESWCWPLPTCAITADGIPLTQPQSRGLLLVAEHLLLQRGLHGLIDALQALLVQFDVDAQIELAAELFIQLVEQLLAAVEQIVEIIV